MAPVIHATLRQLGPLLLAALALLASSTTLRADGTPKIESPQAHQVFQRQGFDPAEAHVHAKGGPALGHADVPVVFMSTLLPKELPWRIVPLGQPSVADANPATWHTAPLTSEPDQRFRARLRVPAGWHRLEFKIGDKVQVVEPVGVGEVLIVAGQSYADGANDELLKVEDPSGRVVALNPKTLAWGIAHDPQPERAPGGTLWPALGDLLVRALNVPVGFVNVAEGGTSSRQWLPGTPLYQRLQAAGKAVERFRAVLWQQGESDVIEKVSTDDYVRNMQTIRTQLARDWNNEAPWLLAKSTLHPTVYNDPDGEGRIRLAIERLRMLPGFRAGPDTDVLGGENRGGPKTRRHFTGLGQRNAALLWFAAVLQEVERKEPPAVAVMKVERLPSGLRYGIWGDKPAKPAPTLVVFAASLEQLQTQQVYSDTGRALAKHGWLMFAVDAPCHGEDKQPGDVGELSGWPGRLTKEDGLVAPFVSRVQSVLNRLIKEGYADETRLAVAGTSRGGFLALHFAAAEPRMKAVVAFAPVTNLFALREFNGHEKLEAAQKLSAINVADKLAGRPVWMIIGNHDDRASTDDALAFIRAVAKAGAKIRKDPSQALPIECILGASAGHAIPPGSHVLAAEFIRKHVAP